MSQKILGCKDVVIMSIAACLGVRWIPVAAGIGPSSLLFWFLGAVIFFLPLALMVAELPCRYPDEGGMYIWVHKGLGQAPAFLMAWFYWSTNLFYYPAIFTFFAATASYIFNKPELANDQTYIVLTVISSFWIFTGLTIMGLRVSKYISEFGGIFGTVLVIVLLIILGFLALCWLHQSATPFNFATLLPNSSLFDNLSNLTILMFAMAGIEVIPTLANVVQHPEKVMSKALLVAALAIFICYALGTIAMNIIASPAEIQKTTGIMQVFGVIALKFHLPSLVPLIATLLVFGELAAITIWLFVPALMFFKTTQKGILPEWLHRHNKYGMPKNALLIQAVLVTIIVLLTALLPSVNEMYQVLVLAATIVYFFPYLFLALAYLKLKFADSNWSYQLPGRKVRVVLMSLSVLVALILGIGISFVPTSDLVNTHAILVYELELVGGPLLLILLGLGLYAYGCRKKQFGSSSR